MSYEVITATTILTLILGWIAVVDLRTGYIPDLANLTLALSGIGVTFVMASSLLISHVIAALVGFSSLLVLSCIYERARSQRGLGGGDIKLFGASGLWLGWVGLPTVLLLAACSGILFTLMRAARGGKLNRYTRLAFGPHLALAILLTWLLGPLEFG